MARDLEGSLRHSPSNGRTQRPRSSVLQPSSSAVRPKLDRYRISILHREPEALRLRILDRRGNAEISIGEKGHR